METNRRVLLGACLAGAGILLSRRSSAQEFEFPSFEETLDYLGSHEGIALLYVRFGLAEALATDLVARLSGATAENPDPANSLPLMPYDRLNDRERNPYLPFQMLLNLAFSEGGEVRDFRQRELARAALLERGDPLTGSRGLAVSMMLSEIAVASQEVGIQVVEGPIADALRSCVHVERIAVVTQDSNNESSFLCRFFPFSYFCSP
jgi:hypothetical protein